MSGEPQKKRKSRTEAIFAGELKRSFEATKAFYLRIPDDPFNSLTKFTHKKPFDAIVVFNGLPCALEYKACRGNKPFVLSSLREHQVNGLILAKEAGMRAFVVINWRELEKSKVLALFLTIDEFLTMAHAGIKSFSIRDALTRDDILATPLPRVKIGSVYGWDVETIFKYHPDVIEF